MRVLSVLSEELPDLNQDCLSHFDCLEIRHDSEETLDFSLIRSRFNLPLIYTHHFADKPQVFNYLSAFNHGFDWIDCDFRFFVAHQNQMSGISNDRLILSWHLSNLESAWNLLDEIAGHSRIFAHSIIKLAFPCDDSALVCQFLRQWNEKLSSVKRVLSVMGKGGEFLRICAPILKQKWSYFCLKNPTAPGQVCLEKLRDEYYPRSFGNQSKMFAVCGDPVSHSQSPKVHNQWFLESNLPHCMVRMPTLYPQILLEYAPDVLAGLACTMPLKAEMSKILGLDVPVNTVLLSDTAWQGFNTDVMAISGLLQKKISDWIHKIKQIVIVGAGGLAQSCIREFLKPGLPMTVINRTESKARELAKRYGIQYRAYGTEIDLLDTLLIQASACAMKDPLEIPFPSDCVTHNTIIVESVYANPDTPLLKAARSKNCVTIAGLEMFYEQARLQNHLFTKELS